MYKIRFIAHTVYTCMLFKTLAYNPLNARFDRIVDIANEFQHMHAIGLSGTGCKASMQHEYSESYVEGFRVHSWGWKNSKHSNKSCGISIMMDSKLFPKASLNAVYSPRPASLAGRGGAVRYKLPFLDICMITFYFSPDVRNANARDANIKLADWIRRTISRLPNRCIVLFACDSNGHTGSEQAWPFIGDCIPEKENLNGKLFRQVLQDNNLVAVNTHIGGDFFLPRPLRPELTTSE